MFITDIINKSMMNDHVCTMQEYKLKQSNNIYVDQADNVIQ